MDQEWGRGIHTDQCNSTERTGLVWVIVAIWNVKVKVKQSCYRPVVAQRVPGS